jgi:hypothetical protein
MNWMMMDRFRYAVEVAIQCKDTDKFLMKGDTIQYIYKNLNITTLFVE